MSALLALILAASQGFAAPQGAKMVESSRKTLLAAFRVRELYAAPEYPKGCLQWMGSPKGDSVLFVPQLSKAARCAEAPAVEEKWMVTKPNKVFLVEEGGRVTLESFLPIQDGSGDGTAVSTDESQENTIDVILAGGGGSLKKSPRSQSDQGGKPADAFLAGTDHGTHRSRLREEERQEGGAGDMGFGPGGRAGWGNGSGETRQGKLALGAGGSVQDSKLRAKVEVPKPSDITLSGDSGVRSPESIVRVIRQHVGGFRYAQERFLKSDSSLSGKLALQFTISPAGDVVAVSIVSSTTRNESFDDDIKLRIRRMKFDQIETGLCKVLYPIEFRTERSPR